MAIAKELLEMLRCPESRQRLIYFPDGEFLFCPASRLKYRVDGDIPVLLIDEAERLDESAAGRLVDEARRLGLEGA